MDEDDWMDVSAIDEEPFEAQYSMSRDAYRYRDRTPSPLLFLRDEGLQAVGGWTSGLPPLRRT